MRKSRSTEACAREVTVVTLHVYDLTRVSLVGKVNSVLLPLGSGAFHVAIEIYGQEWSYGGCSTEGVTGVYVTRPRKDSSHTFRESIHLGNTSLSNEEVGSLLRKLADQWLGCEYHLFRRNCAHFSDALSRALCGCPLPPHVLHLIGVGEVAANLADQVVLRLWPVAKMLASPLAGGCPAELPEAKLARRRVSYQVNGAVLLGIGAFVTGSAKVAWLAAAGMFSWWCLRSSSGGDGTEARRPRAATGVLCALLLEAVAMVLPQLNGKEVDDPSHSGVKIVSSLALQDEAGITSIPAMRMEDMDMVAAPAVRIEEQ